MALRALAAAAPRLRSRAPPRPAVAAAARGASSGPGSEKDQLMRGVLSEYHEVVARSLEMAVEAGERWEVASTYFLEPPEAAQVALAVSRLADVEARPWGGYPNAERVRMRLGRPEVLDAEGAEPKGVTMLDVAGNFMFDAATHRDHLGALMKTGIERNRIGCALLRASQNDRATRCF